MTDTQFWILLGAVLVAFGTALSAANTANRALRLAQRGGGGATPLGAPTKADRKAAELLVQRASALLAKVNALPPAMLGPGVDAKVRDAVLWTAAEVASLGEATPAVAARVAEPVASVQAGMAWLLERVTAIRATPRGSGQHLVDFPHDAWRKNYQAAVGGLEELVAMGNAGKQG